MCSYLKLLSVEHASIILRDYYLNRAQVLSARTKAMTSRPKKEILEVRYDSTYSTISFSVKVLSMKETVQNKYY